MAKKKFTKKNRLSDMITRARSGSIIRQWRLVTPMTDKETGKKTYAYDLHIDLSL